MKKRERYKEIIDLGRKILTNEDRLIKSMNQSNYIYLVSLLNLLVTKDMCWRIIIVINKPICILPNNDQHSAFAGLIISYDSVLKQGFIL